MSYKTVKYGKFRERRNYSRVKSNVELPNLIEVQTDSFDWFVKNGLKELFKDISPISNFTETIELYFEDYEFDEPKHTILECKEKECTYSRPLRANVKLVFYETKNEEEIKEERDLILKAISEREAVATRIREEIKVATGVIEKNGLKEELHSVKADILELKNNLNNLEEKKIKEIKENKIFMGDFPMMTPVGSFIINGAERVIVNQIVRSAGVFFSETLDKKTAQNRLLGQVIPTRGAWIEYEIGSKDILFVKLDRSKRIPLTTLLRAFGLSSNEQIKEVFGENQYLNNTFEKDTTNNADDAILEVYAKIRQGETATVDGARNFIGSRLFDEKRYDLASVGRYKVNKKLDVLSRVLGRRLANDIVIPEKEIPVIFDEETGEVKAEGYVQEAQVFKAGTVVTNAMVEVLNQNRELFTEEVVLDCEMDYRPTYIEKINILIEGADGLDKVVPVVGNYSNEERIHVSISDVIASISYYLNLFEGVGSCDVIDHLGNRRLRLIGELLKNQFRIGLAKMEKTIKDRLSTKETKDMTIQNLVNIRPLTSSLKEFFGSSQLSQFMAQTNPIDELTHKRRISALGPGGLTRDRAGMDVRDVHESHYGRICPIETPEGQNIGLINSLASYITVNKYGFIETPYLKVVNGKVTDEIVRLTAEEEEKYYIAEANSKINDDMMFEEEEVVARHELETKIFPREKIDLIDVSPKQIVSITTACIPFLEHDDANRALMGSNMQRQAIPLLQPEAPFVGTGIEYKAAHDSGTAVVALNDGVVEYVDGALILVRREDGGLDRYDLSKFMRSNQGTCINQKPIVSMGEVIKKSDILADGPSMDKGELALGRNVVVAFMTWNGYNFEDAVIMNERLVREDVYTSIHIEKYEIEARDTKLGKEEITREIPNVGEEGRKYLDAHGIIIPGAEVKEGDILVGKVTPKGQTDPTPEDRLLLAIFGEKSREVRDTSLVVPHGGGGIVHSVKHFTRETDDELAPGVNEVVRVYIVQKRKISEGDKMSGRHGNKGVISNILPSEDMPFLPDGTPIDIMLNPQGVPSRMNIGQVLEIHLGMAAKRLGVHVATPVFDGCTAQDLQEILEEAGMDKDGKTVLYDGRTGEPFDNRISVGVMYMIKLDHMVDDKLHARSVGPYTLVTQQPMGGKAQNGGQRFGEMEVWALEAYGAAYTLQEMLTVKSDDILGRNKVFRAIVDGDPIPSPSLPESFRVLTRELQSLGLYVELISRDTGENEVNKSLVDGEQEDYISKYGF